MDPDIEDFLTRYAATLTTFDAAAAADLWAMPGMILDDRYGGVIEDRAVMAAGLERSFPVYRRLGLASVGYRCERVDDLSDALRLIRVTWLFRDAGGEPLTDSTASYIVRRDDDGGYQACVCIQTDDLEKLQALAAERGVDLSDLGTD